MNYRRYCRWAEWGVVAAVVALHAVIVLWPRSSTFQFPLPEILKDAQWASGMTLVLSWALLGPGWPWVRAVCSSVAIGIFLWIWSTAQGANGFAAFFLLALFGTSFLLLLGMIALRWQVRSAAEVHARAPAQFSLRGLMLTTTIIAVSFGILETLRPLISPASIMAGSDGRIAIEIRELVLGSSVAIVVVASLWVVLQSGALWLRAVMVGVLALLASVYLAHLTEGVGEGFSVFALHFAVAFSAISLLSGVTALPFRLMGYRLQPRHA